MADQVVALMGLAKAQRLFDSVRVATIWRAGFGAAVTASEATMRGEAEKGGHIYHGHLVNSITSTPPTGEGINVEARVGSYGAANAHSLSGGWYSQSGLTPPSGPGTILASWVAQKMPGVSPFVVARAIGRRGYSFGKTDWFPHAKRKIKPLVKAILVYALKSQE